MLAALLAAVALGAPAHAAPFELQRCLVGPMIAGCGTFRVPENRAKPDGRTIGLHVIVIPARHKAEPDAVTYLAGGPGGAATDEAYEVVSMLAAVNENHVIFLVDQRGTGGSRPPRNADPTEYGTRTAMDDLDAVRAALGFAQIDIYGTSYGATAAQVYLKRHRHSVRTIVLDGATFIDRPFYGSFARSAQSALEQVAARCAASTACARTFPHWMETFARLVRDWNRHAVHGMTGYDLAGVVQTMLLSADTAASIPLVVTRAAVGDFGPLDLQVRPGVHDDQMMFWSIWCNEPWVGLERAGAVAHAVRRLRHAHDRGVPKGVPHCAEARGARRCVDASARVRSCRCSSSRGAQIRRTRSATSPAYGRDSRTRARSSSPGTGMRSDSTGASAGSCRTSSTTRARSASGRNACARSSRRRSRCTDE